MWEVGRNIVFLRKGNGSSKSMFYYRLSFEVHDANPMHSLETSKTGCTI